MTQLILVQSQTMRLLSNIVISILVSTGVLFAFVNFYPLFGNDNLGAVSLTDLTTSDTISAFPAVYTANNTILENAINTIEASTTMDTVTSIPNLATIGTITSGTWNGTALTVPYGGTGSTTLTSGGALYGNGTSAVLATEPCADDEILVWTSSVPLCGTQSTDLTIDYTWTGYHIFPSLFATLASTTNATTTNFYASGNLDVSDANFIGGVQVLDKNTAFNFTQNTASTTVYTYTLPANTLTTDDRLHINALCTKTGASSGANFCEVEWGTGSATTSLISGGQFGTNEIVEFDIWVTSTSTSIHRFAGKSINHGSNVLTTNSSAITIDSTALSYFDFKTSHTGASDNIGFHGITVTKY